MSDEPIQFEPRPAGEVLRLTVTLDAEDTPCPKLVQHFVGTAYEQGVMLGAVIAMLNRHVHDQGLLMNDQQREAFIAGIAEVASQGSDHFEGLVTAMWRTP